jgi:hypothetical protein
MAPVRRRRGFAHESCLLLAAAPFAGQATEKMIAVFWTFSSDRALGNVQDATQPEDQDSVRDNEDVNGPASSSLPGCAAKRQSWRQRRRFCGGQH